MHTQKKPKPAAGRSRKTAPAKPRSTGRAAKRSGTGATPLDPTRVLARDVMHDTTLVLRVDDAIHVAAEQLEDVGGGAPVVDSTGRLVGVLTSTDIARSEHVAEEGVSTRPEPREVETLAGMVDESDQDEEVFSTEEYDTQVLGGLRVADWMTPRVVQVAPETTVAQVARHMLDEGIHRVFVVDRNHLVGVVSTDDLIQLLAEPKP